MSEELAWCAGFFDGEGCIHVTSHHGDRNHGLYVEIAQKTAEILYLFQERIVLGKVHGPYLIENKYPAYQWMASGRFAGQACQLMLPHLVGKRSQAVLAIEFAATLQDPRHKGGLLSDSVRERRREIRTELQRLKRGQATTDDGNGPTETESRTE